MLNEIRVEIPRMTSSLCNAFGSLESARSRLLCLLISLRVITMSEMNPVGIINIIP